MPEHSSTHLATEYDNAEIPSWPFWKNLSTLQEFRFAIRTSRAGRLRALESRQLLSITLPQISDVTLPAGTTVYVPLNGSSAGQTVNYEVSASDYAKVMPVMMPAANQDLEMDVNINGTDQRMTFQLFDNLSPRRPPRLRRWSTIGFYNGLQIYRNGMDQSRQSVCHPRRQRSAHRQHQAG